MNSGNFGDSQNNYDSSGSALFKPENQSMLQEFISSATVGDVKRANTILGRLIPSQKERVLAQQEMEMIKVRGEIQRQLVALMGNALYKDAKMRLDAQEQKVLLTLDRERLEHYTKESQRVHTIYEENLLRFCNDFLDSCKKISDECSEELRDVLKQRLQKNLFMRIKSLDTIISTFENRVQW